MCYYKINNLYKSFFYIMKELEMKIICFDKCFWIHVARSMVNSKHRTFIFFNFIIMVVFKSKNFNLSDLAKTQKHLS